MKSDDLTKWNRKNNRRHSLAFVIFHLLGKARTLKTQIHLNTQTVYSTLEHINTKVPFVSHTNKHAIKTIPMHIVSIHAFTQSFAL